MTSIYNSDIILKKGINMKKSFNSKILFIVSMFIFGTLSIFVKKINLTSGEIALYRAVLAAVVIGIYLLISKQKINVFDYKKEFILICISGIAMGFNWVFLFEAYNYTSVSIATLSYYFAPTIVMIVSTFLFKEKLKTEIFFEKMLTCRNFSSKGVNNITKFPRIHNNV